MVLKTVLATLVAWAMHAGLVTWYIRYFKSSFALSFRIVHGLEIFLGVGLIFLIFNRWNLSASPTIQIATALSVLVLIDLILFFWLRPDLRQNFDGWHVMTAYVAVGLAIFTVKLSLR